MRRAAAASGAGVGTHCDRCGYSLEGTPDTPVCPECGLDFAASRAMRVGSPWQQRPSLWRWVKTVVLMIFRPRRVLGVVSFDNDESNFQLFCCNVLIVPGGVFLLLAVAGMTLALREPSAGEGAVVLCAVLFVAPAAVLAGLALWFAGRQVIRWACRPSPEIRRGSHVLAVHASCVLAPASGVLLVNGLFGFPEHWVAVLGGGVVWFLALCLVASRWPDRTAGPGGG